MLKLRKILLCKYLYYSLFSVALIYVLIFNCCVNHQSKYNVNNKIITGIITEYNIDGNCFSFIVKGKEKVRGTYYLKSEKEKIYLEKTIKYGITIRAKGLLEEPNDNTIPNTFNYKKYLNHHYIFYTLKVDKIEIINNQENIFYKIKNLVNNKINRYSLTKNYLQTFIMGNKQLLTSEITSSYQNLGISHLFAISGMHVSLFVTILLFILKKLKIGETKRYLITIMFLALYSFIAGFTPSVLRATLFFSLLAINKIFFTNVKVIYIFLVTLSILLFINPYMFFDLGAQYSFLTSLGLILFSDKLNNKNYFINLLKVSFIAFLFSIPVAALNFYEVNLLSIFNNLIFVPLVTIIIYPLSLIILLLPFLEIILYYLIIIMEWLATFFNSLSINVIIPRVSILFIILYYLLIYLYYKKEKKLFLFFILFLLIINRYKNSIDDVFYIYFLDVGQGDSCLLIAPFQKEVIMIDTGGKLNYQSDDWKTTNKSYNISDNTIYFMKSIGINKIDSLITTHGDEDHAGEVINIVDKIDVHKVIFNNDNYNHLELEIIKKLEEKEIKYYQNIRELKINNSKLIFLNTKLYNNENDNSNVIYTVIEDTKILLMGDAGIKREQSILDKYNLKDIDILKIGHHGSNSSSSKVFIEKINPQNCLISVGKNNKYGHPKEAVLKTLDKCHIYRTDLSGSIEFQLKSNNYIVKK